MISLVFLTAVASNAVVFGQSNGQDVINITLDEPVVFSFDSYKEKVCKSEPTCNLLDSAAKDIIPKEYTTLKYRNCMCDADCVKYGDCCLDSKYYKEAEQKQNFQKYQCSLLERVYMKTNCPSNYKNDQVKSKCAKSTLPLDSADKKLIVPVTNIKTRITYGNEYCAQCHGDKDYQPWNIITYCSVTLTKFVGHDDFKQNYPLANLDNDTAPMIIKSPTYRAENFADLTENSTLPPVLNNLLGEAEEAAKYVKFDNKTKTFYSVYNGKNFTCSYGRNTPISLEPYLRHCAVLPVVRECPNSANSTLVKKCQSYTSIVYDDFGAYRNKECAACNSVTKNLPGCFMAPPNLGAASNLFSSGDKAGGANPCANAALKDKFC